METDRGIQNYNEYRSITGNCVDCSHGCGTLARMVTVNDQGHASCRRSVYERKPSANQAASATRNDLDSDRDDSSPVICVGSKNSGMVMVAGHHLLNEARRRASHPDIRTKGKNWPDDCATDVEICEAQSRDRSGWTQAAIRDWVTTIVESERDSRFEEERASPESQCTQCGGQHTHVFNWGPSR